MSSESVSEAFAAIFMRWYTEVHIATVTARIAAFCKNGGSGELSSERREESRNGRIRGRGRALYKQAFTITCVRRPNAEKLVPTCATCGQI